MSLINRNNKIIPDDQEIEWIDIPQQPKKVPVINEKGINPFHTASCITNEEKFNNNGKDVTMKNREHKRFKPTTKKSLRELNGIGMKSQSNESIEQAFARRRMQKKNQKLQPKYTTEWEDEFISFCSNTSSSYETANEAPTGKNEIKDLPNVTQ